MYVHLLVLLKLQNTRCNDKDLITGLANFNTQDDQTIR